MGKDFRVGLMTGVVLAVAALIWVATRPSLSPRAKVQPAAQPAAGAGQSTENPLPWESVGAAEANNPRPLGTSPGTAPVPAPLNTAASPGGSETRPQSTVPAVGQAQATDDNPVGDLTIYERSEPIKTTRFHVVRKNETLSAIAQQYYGSSNSWRQILAANQNVIKDANKISPGTKLIIPD